MAQARTVYVTCPLCGGMLEVDTENGKVVRHFKAKPKMESEDTLIEGLKAVKAGEGVRDEKFREAREKEKSKIERIESLFREKKREVEESGDTSKPLRPIDLD